MSNMTDFIDKKLDEVSDFYIKDSALPNNTKYTISNEIFNQLLIELHHSVRTCNVNGVDGTVYSINTDNELAATLLYTRAKYPDEEATIDFYKDLMLRTDYKMVVHNNRLYGGLEPDVGLYLMKHNCLDMIFDICNGDYVCNTGYNTIKVMDTYIKMGRSIHSKLKMFETLEDETAKKVAELPIRVRELQYIRYKLYKELYNEDEPVDYSITVDSNSKSRCKCVEQALKHDIGYYNLVHRVEKEGMTIEDAIKLGIKERETYGLMNENRSVNTKGSLISRSTNGSTANLINYIKYLAAKESGTGAKPKFIGQEQKAENTASYQSSKAETVQKRKK